MESASAVLELSPSHPGDFQRALATLSWRGLGHAIPLGSRRGQVKRQHCLVDLAVHPDDRFVASDIRPACGQGVKGRQTRTAVTWVG